MKTYFIGILFMFGSLLLGECYPFSQFPMYSSFPNYAYVFYVTDSKERFIPLEKLNTHGGALSHKYFSIANKLNIWNGYGAESAEELNQIGKLMFYQLKKESIRNIDSIRIHRIHFFHKGNQLVKQDKIIYAFP